jgi:hypothetical protein
LPFIPCFRAILITAGWCIFAYLCFKVAGAKIENKVYDPFEILGLGSVSFTRHEQTSGVMMCPDLLLDLGSDTERNQITLQEAIAHVVRPLSLFLVTLSDNSGTATLTRFSCLPMSPWNGLKVDS